jgi:hypothetical protein
MTSEEMVAWKRWHDLGRRKYQLRFALRTLVAVLGTTFLLGLMPNPPVTLVNQLVGAVVGSISVYFFAGHHWTARDEEYCWLLARGGQA